MHRLKLLGPAAAADLLRQAQFDAQLGAWAEAFRGGAPAPARGMAPREPDPTIGPIHRVQQCQPSDDGQWLFYRSPLVEEGRAVDLGVNPQVLDALLAVETPEAARSFAQAYGFFGWSVVHPVAWQDSRIPWPAWFDPYGAVDPVAWICRHAAQLRWVQDVWRRIEAGDVVTMADQPLPDAQLAEEIEHVAWMQRTFEGADLPAQSVVAALLDGFAVQVRARVELAAGVRRPVVRYHTQTLVDAVYWLMAQRLATPGGFLRQCSWCRRTFFTTDPRTVFCPPAGRATESSCGAAQRQRKRRLRRWADGLTSRGEPAQRASARRPRALNQGPHAGQDPRA